MFSYNNINTSAIISGKIFKLARILFKILFRLLPKFLKFRTNYCAGILDKIGPEILQPEYLNFLIKQSPKDSVSNFSTHYFVLHIFRNNKCRQKWSDKNETC